MIHASDIARSVLLARLPGGRELRRVDGRAFWLRRRRAFSPAVDRVIVTYDILAA